MSTLLSKEIIDDILKSTGAVDGTSLSRLLTGDFRKFKFQVKKRAEFNLVQYDDAFDRLAMILEKDWKDNYVSEVSITRDYSQFVELHKYSLRESSLCCQLKSHLFAESFFIYFQVSSFYFLLNDYLGGANIKSDKGTLSLTDIESSLFKQVIEQMALLCNEAFLPIESIDLKVLQFNLDDQKQKQEFTDRYYMAEFVIKARDNSCRVTFALPLAYLNLVKEKQQKETDSSKVPLDPLWQKAVVGAFMESHVDLVVNLGNLQIPFGKSVSLKVGDELVWEKRDTQVTVMQADEPRVIATLGVVDGNFALRVDELLKD